MSYGAPQYGQPGGPGQFAGSAAPGPASMLQTRSGQAVHTYSKEELRAFALFVNEELGKDPDLAGDLPLNPDSEALFHVIAKGVLLAKMVNVVKSGVVDESKIVKRPVNTFQLNQNLQLGIQGCKELGLVVVNIGAEDLREMKPHLVLGLIWQLVKMALLSKVNLTQHPELVAMLSEHEDINQFLSVAPEINLLRWFNFHLKRAGHPRQVNNFSSDICDAENYLVLLEQIAPQYAPKGIHYERDPAKRAQMVDQIAHQLGCGSFISPEAILAGNDKLNLAFTAYLFNKFPGLELMEDNTAQQKVLEEAESLLRLKFEEEEKARQLQWQKEEDMRRQLWDLEEQMRQAKWLEEEEKKRQALAMEEDLMRTRLGEEERRLALLRAQEEAESRRRKQQQEDERRRWEEQKRREEAEREAARRAEEERRRQWENEQRLLEAQRKKAHEDAMTAARAKLEEDRRRIFAEAQAKAEEEARRKVAEEEARRQKAWADYNAQQEAAKQAADLEKQRQAAWAEYYRQQEAAKQQAEADRQRQAAAEAERQRQLEAERQRQQAEAFARAEAERRAAAEAAARAEAERRAAAEAAARAEAERQRLAAEAERLRQLHEAEKARMAAEAERQRQMAEAQRLQMAAEMERQRQMAAEAERQRLAALEAERLRLQQEAAARAAAEAAARAAAEEEARRQAAWADYNARQLAAAQEAERQRQLAAQQQALLISQQQQATLITQQVIPPKFPIPRMIISVLRGRRLSMTGRIGRPDPYLVIVHSGRRVKTREVKGTTDPIWNMDFEFHNVLETDIINVSVYDKEAIGKDHFMGEFNLNKTDFIHGNLAWFSLRPREFRNDNVQGDVELRFTLFF